MTAFQFAGESFEYAAESPYGTYAWLEFCDAMANDDVDVRTANAAAYRMALASVDKSDRGRFQRLCRKENPPVKEFMEIAQGWIGDLTERPTGQPTDSVSGQSDTGEQSDTEPAATVTPLAVRPVRGDLALAEMRSTG